MEIAPFRGLRFDPERRSGAGSAAAEAVTAPPYDVISPDEHRRLLDASPSNVVHLTLGTSPGEASSYEERGRLLRRWIDSGVLRAEETPCLYAYEVDYAVPGGEGGAERRERMYGLVAIGKLAPYAERVVLPHEQTFPEVVDDRRRLLEATRANLESILLLVSDADKAIDGLLEEACGSDPLVRVEAKPREYHAVYRIGDGAAISRLVDLMRDQRPIIADGHHRYTTSLRYLREAPDSPGAGWRMMTFANLYQSGLSILATHRLVRLSSGAVSAVVGRLKERLAPATETDWDLGVETAEERLRFRIPAELRAGRKGVAGTTYAILHDVILDDWLREWLGDVTAAGRQPRSRPSPTVEYYKEGTGELEALRSGRGDLLFRMLPVEREEFRAVVEGGEVFPHKTTYFYPKLWSGLLLWELEEPAAPRGA